MSSKLDNYNVELNKFLEFGHAVIDMYKNHNLSVDDIAELLKIKKDIIIEILTRCNYLQKEIK